METAASGQPNVYVAFTPSAAGERGDGTLWLYVRIECATKLLRPPDVQPTASPQSFNAPEFMESPAPQSGQPLFSVTGDDLPGGQLGITPRFYSYLLHPGTGAASGVYDMTLTVDGIDAKWTYRFKAPLLIDKDAKHGIDVVSVDVPPVTLSATDRQWLHVKVTNKTQFRIHVTNYAIADNDNLLRDVKTGVKTPLKNDIIIDPGDDGEAYLGSLIGKWDAAFTRATIHEDPKLTVTIWYDALLDDRLVRQDQVATASQNITYSIGYAFWWVIPFALVGVVVGLAAKCWYTRNWETGFWRPLIPVMAIATLLLTFSAAMDVELVAQGKVKLLVFDNPMVAFLLGGFVGLDPRKAIKSLQTGLQDFVGRSGSSGGKKDDTGDGQ